MTETAPTQAGSAPIDAELVRLQRRLQELRAIRDIVSDRRTLMPDDYDEAFALLVASETRYRRLPRVAVLRDFARWGDRWGDVGRESSQTKLFGFIDGALDSASRRLVRRIDERQFIFFNYRVDDAREQVRLMYDGITRRFGSIAAFLDNRSIRLAADFERQIDAALESVRIFLVCIGPDWNVRAASSSTEWVVVEIKRALGRERRFRTAGGTPLAILPVLLNGVRMPEESQLPDAIKGLAKFQGVRVSPDERFAKNPGVLADRIVEILLEQLY